MNFGVVINNKFISMSHTHTHTLGQSYRSWCWELCTWCWTCGWCSRGSGTIRSHCYTWRTTRGRDLRGKGVKNVIILSIETAHPVSIFLRKMSHIQAKGCEIMFVNMRRIHGGTCVCVWQWKNSASHDRQEEAEDKGDRRLPLCSPLQPQGLKDNDTRFVNVFLL